MSIERVKAYFRDLGMEGRVWEFDQSSATVELAAEALSVRPARIAKTLSFKIDDGCVLIVTAGDARIDNGKFKAQFHTKARMLAHDEVEPLTGAAPGGVCPFAVPGHVPVYLDVSLQRFSTVFPACGSDNSAIELTPEALYRLSGATAWIDVCKDWEAGDDPALDEALFDPGELTDGVVRLRLSELVPANEKTGYVPAYKCGIEQVSDGASTGTIDLRIGYVRGTYYGGNIGYEIFEPYRGNRYAERAVRLLLPLAKKHGMPYLIISCAAENAASKATIEAVGGKLIEARIPPRYTELYQMGAHGEHLIYRVEL